MPLPITRLPDPISTAHALSKVPTSFRNHTARLRFFHGWLDLIIPSNGVPGLFRLVHSHLKLCRLRTDLT